jgi:hypothetical protein
MPYDQLFLQPQLIADRELCCIVITTVFHPQRTQFVSVPKKSWQRSVNLLTASGKLLLLSEFKPNRNASTNVKKNSKFFKFHENPFSEVALFIAKV